MMGLCRSLLIRDKAMKNGNKMSLKIDERFAGK